MKKETKHLIGRAATVIGLSAALVFLLAKQKPEAKFFEQSNPNIVSKEGYFHDEGLELFDIYGNADIHYLFKSDDNETWCNLTESEIGFIPNTTDKYILTYDNGGTPEQDLSICGCLPEWECECHVYDDEFISIRRVSK